MALHDQRCQAQPAAQGGHKRFEKRSCVPLGRPGAGHAEDDEAHIESAGKSSQQSAAGVVQPAFPVEAMQMHGTFGGRRIGRQHVPVQSAQGVREGRGVEGGMHGIASACMR